MFFVCECLPRLLINSSIARKNLAFSKFGRLPSWQPPIVGGAFAVGFHLSLFRDVFYWWKKSSVSMIRYTLVTYSSSFFVMETGIKKSHVFQPCSERSNHPAFLYVFQLAGGFVVRDSGCRGHQKHQPFSTFGWPTNIRSPTFGKFQSPVLRGRYQI